MTLMVRMREPHVSLMRVRHHAGPGERGVVSWARWFCPRMLRRGRLLPSLTIMFLSVGIASVAFLVITEVGLVQKHGGAVTSVGNRLLTRVRHSPQWSLFGRVQSTVPPIRRADTFKIEPLLRRNAPSVELSAQMTLNSLYGVEIGEDLQRYHEYLTCLKSERPSRGVRTARGWVNATKCTAFSQIPARVHHPGWASIPDCDPHPQHLVGQVLVRQHEILQLKDIKPEVAQAVQHGGWWEPPSCHARHSVALVIPYRDRWPHLTTLLNHLHGVLQRQQIRYKIFVVEQVGNDTFNKGMIMNAAFLEAVKSELFHCFIFHDVDLIPENDHNLYTCPQMPRHLSVAVNELGYQLPYNILVGGVFAIRTEHFFKVNGYSNLYWGWGGEDDDMGFRVVQSGLEISRPVSAVARYTMIKHVKRRPLNLVVRRKLVWTAKRRYRLDGLNTIQYKLMGRTVSKWYTQFLIDVGKPPFV